jgi:3-hydroxymyristoyl/3-hydroxydecanoyl-(acyl carrier protein) dehydratase
MSADKDEHFCAFSFVDRIRPIQSRHPVRGSYAIPSSIDCFPMSLVAEAVGQLAAWAAMASLEFRCRPVAGLAGTIELLSPVRPGQTLELSTELETLDTEAVAYGGAAEADGVPVLKLQHCLGPMVRADEFDEPQALRDRYGLLVGGGARAGAFRAVPRVVAEPADGEPGASLSGELRVPEEAPFFLDHFPRRPVFPGSLLIQAKLELAAAFVQQLDRPEVGSQWVPRRITDVKLRTFIPPGARLKLEIRLEQAATDGASVTATTRMGTRVVGSARVRFDLEPSA